MHVTPPRKPGSADAETEATRPARSLTLSVAESAEGTALLGALVRTTP